MDHRTASYTVTCHDYPWESYPVQWNGTNTLQRRPIDASPTLTRETRGDVAYWTDVALLQASGVLVAFSERGGGTSSAPFASLNLAAHVGDEPAAVDANRSALLHALSLSRLRDALTMADQVHGGNIAEVQADTRGAGAFAASGRPPVAATDTLVTCEPETPLALCFADCVPVVLVAPGPCVAVVHAGWRGALIGLPGSSAAWLARLAGVQPAEVIAYIGPHIGACCYEVDERIMSQFVNVFGTVARAESGALDLGSVVSQSLTRAGVQPCSIAHLGVCTAQTTERFFSHRAEAGLTGRHGALACILASGS